MSTEEAIRKYDWLSDYWWQAVQVDTDKYTAAAQLYQTHGYFIRSLPNQKLPSLSRLAYLLERMRLPRMCTI